MHLIRRAALRAASSAPSTTSFLAKSRSINTSSPFALRFKAQSPISSSVFRRFNSDEATKDGAYVESADAEHGSVQAAVESTSGSLAEETSESGGHEAANYDYQPRQPRESRPYQDRGERQPYSGGGRGGGFQSRDRGFPPRERTERKIEPAPVIYVGNLIFDATAEDLQREFAQFGPIKSCTIATDARGMSKGFGYIEYSSIPEATAAIEARNQTVMEGRRLVVNYMSKSSGVRGDTGPTKTLFIGNLAFEMTDADLNKLFRDLKNVVDVRVAIDRRTGQPRGFAHADFSSVESAVEGKAILDNKEVYGRVLRVDFSAGSKQAIRGGGEGGSSQF